MDRYEVGETLVDDVLGLDFDGQTGILSITSGYVIPTTTQESNWGDAYTHIIESGASHTFINQNVTTTGTPTFADLLVSKTSATDMGMTFRNTQGGGNATSNVTIDALTTTSNLKMGKIVFQRTGTYSIENNRDSSLEFYTAEDGVDMLRATLSTSGMVLETGIGGSLTIMSLANSMVISPSSIASDSGSIGFGGNDFASVGDIAATGLTIGNMVLGDGTIIDGGGAGSIAFGTTNFTGVGTVESGHVGIGTAVTSSEGLKYLETLNGITGTTFGILVQPTINAGAGTPNYAGLRFLIMPTGTGVFGTVSGIDGVVESTTGNGAMTFSDLIGLNIVANAKSFFGDISTVSVLTGGSFEVRSTSSSIITDSYLLNLENSQNSSTNITNEYGIRIPVIDNGNTLNWAIFSEGGNSSHAGNFRIGSNVAPTVALDVTGAANIGDGTNETQISATGDMSFVGTATVFEDIVISLSAARVPASNAPTWSSFIGTLNAYTYGLDDFQEFTSEIAHSYKEGSTFEFHIHGATNGLEGVDKTIKFEIEYEVVDNQTSGAFGDVFNGTTTIPGEITIPASTVDKTAWVIDVGDDATGNFLQGSSIKGRVRRIASTGTEPASDPFVYQVGIHIEKDTVGSRTELTK